VRWVEHVTRTAIQNPKQAYDLGESAAGGRILLYSARVRIGFNLAKIFRPFF
jgi:hypothetical protein